MESRRAIFRRIAAAYLTLLFAAAAVPAQQLGAPLPLDSAVRSGTLPNGLAWFVRRNARPEKRAALRLRSKRGPSTRMTTSEGWRTSSSTWPSRVGALRPGELVAWLESIGARFGPHVNAYSSYDETVYMPDVPTDRAGTLDRGLLALADFAGGMTLHPEEIDRERGVVIEEWRGRQGAAARMQVVHAQAIYGSSKYADRLPIGTPDVLQTFTAARLRDFYEAWYRPDRMAIVVVGDVDPEAATAPRPVHPIPPYAETAVRHRNRR